MLRAGGASLHMNLAAMLRGGGATLHMNLAARQRVGGAKLHVNLAPVQLVGGATLNVNLAARQQVGGAKDCNAASLHELYYRYTVLGHECITSEDSNVQDLCTEGLTHYKDNPRCLVRRGQG
ncbi:hypothetical protein RRG08_027521 [Elysia crispata]|uniref:Uncharacterized protein n=1 Tax=Elysia crispata TaxID=231223 RepID=A0AAE0YRJ6_9GAST|nr:hypothetical protein RRG08_027521 [Elysia crispata]